MIGQPIVQRAMELARTGHCRTITEIREALRQEGYASIDAYLQGGGFRSELRKLMIAARAPAPAAEQPVTGGAAATGGPASQSHGSLDRLASGQAVARAVDGEQADA